LSSSKIANSPEISSTESGWHQEETCIQQDCQHQGGHEPGSPSAARIEVENFPSFRQQQNIQQAQPQKF
jgi:hypothetical protein